MLLYFTFFVLLNAQVVCNEGITCEYNSQTQTLTVSSTTKTTDLSSLTLNGISNSQIVHLVIGDGITSITSASGFTHNNGLQDVTCPQDTCKLKSISQNIFTYCENLQTVSIPTLETVGPGSFLQCESLTNFDFSSISKIGGGAFKTTNLKDVSLPKTIETIGDGAFQFSPIYRFTVEDGCEYFYSHEDVLYKIFDGEVILFIYPPEKNSETYTVEERAMTVANYAFYKTKYLKTIDFKNVKTLKGSAFYEPATLETIKMGKNLVNLQGGVFTNCFTLKEFIVDPENTEMESDDGVLYSKYTANRALLKYPVGKETSKTYSIPAGVHVIYDKAFEGNKGIEELTIAEDVYSIHSYAFSGCSNLKKVTLSGNIRSIGPNAFSTLANLETVIIGDNVKMIGYAMFMMCPKLSSLQLGSGLLTIEASAFMMTAITSVDIPDSVRFIMGSAFASCSELTSVTIGTDTIEIASSAFSTAPKLETINLRNANSLVRLDSRCFAQTNVLKEITIPDNVLIIAANAFVNSEALTKITYEGVKQPSHCDAEAFDVDDITEINVPDDYEQDEFCGIQLDMLPQVDPTPDPDNSSSSMMIMFLLALMMIIF